MLQFNVLERGRRGEIVVPLYMYPYRIAEPATAERGDP